VVSTLHHAAAAAAAANKMVFGTDNKTVDQDESKGSDAVFGGVYHLGGGEEEEPENADWVGCRSRSCPLDDDDDDDDGDEVPGLLLLLPPSVKEFSELKDAGSEGEDDVQGLLVFGAFRSAAVESADYDGY